MTEKVMLIYSAKIYLRLLVRKCMKSIVWPSLCTEVQHFKETKRELVLVV